MFVSHLRPINRRHCRPARALPTWPGELSTSGDVHVPPEAVMYELCTLSSDYFLQCGSIGKPERRISTISTVSRSLSSENGGTPDSIACLCSSRFSVSDRPSCRHQCFGRERGTRGDFPRSPSPCSLTATLCETNYYHRVLCVRRY